MYLHHTFYFHYDKCPRILRLEESIGSSPLYVKMAAKSYLTPRQYNVFWIKFKSQSLILRHMPMLANPFTAGRISS